MKARYQSLYFASIDVPRALLLLFAWICAPFASRSGRRRELETAVREQLGEAAVFSFGSARGALAACLRAAGIGRGDSVLLSSFTCLAVPTAVLCVEALPEYVDIDPVTLNTPVESIVAALHPRVRAIVVQHTFGRSAQIEKLVAVARERGLIVIEDCALSVGSRRAGHLHGTFGDAAIFSMELSKTISSGWGGVLAVRNETLARRLGEQFSGVPEPRGFTTARRVIQAAISGVCFQRWLFPVGRYIVALGFRLGFFKLSTPSNEIAGQPDARFVERLSGTHAVLAAAQWRRLPKIAAVCASHGLRLRAALARAGMQVLAQPPAEDVAVAPRVAFLVDDRAAAFRWFEGHGVELGSWFDGPLAPLPDPVVFNYDPAKYPHAMSVARRVANFASHCRMRDEDVERLMSLVESYVAEHGAGNLPREVTAS